MGYSISPTNQQALVYSLDRQTNKMLQGHSLELLLRDLSNNLHQVGYSVVAQVSMQPGLQEHQGGLKIQDCLVSHKTMVSLTNLPLALLVPHQLSQVTLEDYLVQINLQVKDYLEQLRLLHKIPLVVAYLPNLHNLHLVVQVCLVQHSQQAKEQDNHYLDNHNQLQAYLELQNPQCSKIYSDNQHSLPQVIKVSSDQQLLHSHQEVFLEQLQLPSQLQDKVYLVNHNKHRVYLANNRHQGKLQRDLLLAELIWLHSME